ncbi:MAG: hypothetical protein JNN30_10275 [Rhodanobacteraceae bacterium]|nr:hypothetical protein [Rhodanobacteraceae bacterium]
MAIRGAGGTPGGIGEFLLGFALAVAGGWLLSNQVIVSGGSWNIWGYNTFGLSLLPFVLGVAMLFFNGRSVLGWLLTMGGLVIVFAGVIVNLRVYFVATSLFNTLLILVLLFGGIGLLARSLRSHGPAES